MSDDSRGRRAQPGGVGWLAWAGLICVAPGLAVWAWTRPDLSGLLTTNARDGVEPLHGLGFAAVSLLAGGALYVRAELRRRHRTPALSRGAVMGELNGHLRATAALLILPLLSVWKIEVSSPKLTLAVIFATACLAAASVYSWSRWLAGDGIRTRLAAAVGRVSRRRNALAVLALLVVAQAAWMIHLGIVRHQVLGSRIFDLGIFDNMLFHGLRGELQVSTFLKGDTFTSAHFAPVVHLLTPIYALAPRAETLIVAQAVWMASGAIPLYLIAVERLERPWVGVAVAASYLLHPSLHGVTLFDFHALTLLGPLAAWAVLFLARRAWRRYAVLVVLILLTREDTPFFVLGLGLYAWLGLGHRLVGLSTIAAAVAYLVIVKFGFMAHPDLFMPDTEGSYRYANRFRGMIPDPETGGVTDLLATTATNPAFVVRHVLAADKLYYLAFLLAPVSFLALAQVRMWWLFGFGLAFSMLASGTNLFFPYLHYTIWLFPVFVVATPDGIANLQRLGARVGLDGRAIASALAVAIVVSAGLCAHKFGALTDSRAFQAGYLNGVVWRVSPEAQRRLDWVRAAVTSIPTDEWVSASASLGPHVSNRLRVRAYRHYPDSEYLLVNRADLDKKKSRALRRKVRRREYERIDHLDAKLELYRRRRD